MPSYRCTRFNRVANTPSRYCSQCYQLVKPASRGSRKTFYCPTHGLISDAPKCDCEGCRKSALVRQASSLKHNLFTKTDRRERLDERAKRKEMIAKGLEPRHICPQCKKTGSCTEPYYMKEDKKEYVNHFCPHCGNQWEDLLDYSRFLPHIPTYGDSFPWEGSGPASEPSFFGTTQGKQSKTIYTVEREPFIGTTYDNPRDNLPKYLKSQKKQLHLGRYYRNLHRTKKRRRKPREDVTTDFPAQYMDDLYPEGKDSGKDPYDYGNPLDIGPIN